jgi:hypothetical protein
MAALHVMLFAAFSVTLLVAQARAAPANANRDAIAELAAGDARIAKPAENYRAPRP